MTGDPAQAEDLAQETFVKAFRNLAAFDPTRRLSSWLFRIAHNTALDALRRVKPVYVAIDPGATPARVSFWLGGTDASKAQPAVVVIESQARGALTLANVTQEY